MAGYSATPLEKKLGIKPAFDVAFVNAPENFAGQLNLPAGVNVRSISKSKEFDFIQVFVKSKKALATAFEYSGKLNQAECYGFHGRRKHQA